MSGVLRNDFLSRDMNWWNLDRQRGKESVLEGQRARAKAERGVAMVVVGKQSGNHAWP